MALLILWPSFSFAEEIISSGEPLQIIAPSEVLIPEVKAPDLFGAIDRAKVMLKEHVAEEEKNNPTPKIVTSRNIAFDITLAVWDRASDEIKLVEAKKDKKSLTLKTPYPHAIMVTLDNGVNSRYALPAGADKLVVGVVHPIFKDVTVKKKQPKFELHDKVYIPYNTAFYTPEALRRGSDYLSYLLRDAYDQVRAAGIKSRAFPDKLLADVADPYLVKSIAIIEHADTQIYSDEEPERAVGRFLITLALNGEEAFDFSVSSAGARGLVQFMPATYKLIANKRPDLNLIQDFVSAMADHTNAVKAQMVLLDENLASMPKAVRTLMLTESGRVAPYLAAAYNGGITRVRSSYASWGEEWYKYRMPRMDELQTQADKMDARIKSLKKTLTKKGLDAKLKKQYTNELSKLQKDRVAVHDEYWDIKNHSLYRETANYVSKLNTVYAMLSAGYFATPNSIDGGIGKGIAAK